MRPFLRPTDRGKLAPVGWVSEPAGQWAGREVEVVYDPGRHDVAFVRGDVTDEARAGFAEGGYRRVAVDGTSEMWVRDHAEVVAAALDRVADRDGLEQSAAVGSELGGRSL
ncbi:MAG: hypothetical protein MUF83_01480 [Acidimicrobiales bacterium]|jgi:hypothetical protein|nr:hypothetical protein [Acidimicrobiales bacterium]